MNTEQTSKNIFMYTYLPIYFQKKKTFLKLTLEFFGFLLYPCKFQAKESFTLPYCPRNPSTVSTKLGRLHPSKILRPETNHQSRPLPWPSRNSTWFFLAPLETPLAISSIPLEIPYPQLPMLYLVYLLLISGIARSNSKSGLGALRKGKLTFP